MRAQRSVFNVEKKLSIAALSQHSPRRLMLQVTLADNLYSGHVLVFRGRRGDVLKVLWFDGHGLLLLAKRLEKGRFVWP